jgi:hypothetical protein
VPSVALIPQKWYLCVEKYKSGTYVTRLAQMWYFLVIFSNSTRDFAVGSSGVSKVHQLCVIITEAEEENNNEGSKKVDR